MPATQLKPFVAIACGGTGGHLFPGLAVAEALQIRGCDVALLISPKDVDQQAVKSAVGMQVVTLPAVGLTRGAVLGFARGFWQSYCAAKALFQQRAPKAVLAMGGFTSAPPVLAGKAFGAATFFHESNAIPGRANRLLAHFVDEGFVGFDSATNHLFMQRITTTGTPVRPQFQQADAAASRMAMGLDSQKPVLLVMGGSQGASGVNDLTLGALPMLAQQMPTLQYLHLTGTNDFEKVRAAYAALGVKAVVRPFLTEMEYALGAATVTISRSGASSLAELAAMRVPSILIPFPTAADNHQFYNANALVKTGAAMMLEQKRTSPEQLAAAVTSLVNDASARAAMSTALVKWDAPEAAEKIASRVMPGMSGVKPFAGFPGQKLFRPELPATKPPMDRPAQLTVTR
jgi:UDP-N-acetylglucosamine--N-acetylmuramyl-(pentapeptide) pyrophosphoryl-undecaprenol N-acetylglucosamine transferase